MHYIDGPSKNTSEHIPAGLALAAADFFIMRCLFTLGTHKHTTDYMTTDIQFTVSQGSIFKVQRSRVANVL